MQTVAEWQPEIGLRPTRATGFVDAICLAPANSGEWRPRQAQPALRNLMPDNERKAEAPSRGATRLQFVRQSFTPRDPLTTWRSSKSPPRSRGGPGWRFVDRRCGPARFERHTK